MPKSQMKRATAADLHLLLSFLQAAILSLWVSVLPEMLLACDLVSQEADTLCRQAVQVLGISVV